MPTELGEMIGFAMRYFCNWPPGRISSSLLRPAVWVTFLFLGFKLFDPSFQNGFHCQLLQVVEGGLAKLLERLGIVGPELEQMSVFRVIALIDIGLLLAFGGGVAHWDFGGYVDFSFRGLKSIISSLQAERDVAIRFGSDVNR